MISIIEEPAEKLETPAAEESPPDSTPRPKPARKRAAKPKKTVAKKSAKPKAKRKAKPTPKKAAATKTPKRKPPREIPKRVRKDGKPDMRKGPKGNSPSKVKRYGEKGYGMKVAKARKAKGWSQRELAEKLGCTQPAVCNVEKGTVRAGLNMKAALRHLLRVK